MQTKCPQCRTQFRVHKTQLKQADGNVRCGNCDAIFNGYDHLTEDDTQAGSHTQEKIKRMLLGQQESSPLATATWSLALTLVTLLLLLQLAYMQREQLSRHEHLGHYVVTLCGHFDWCQLKPPRNLGQIQLVSRNVYSHPNVENALMINAVVTNTAAFSQPFPTLLVSMSNVRGTTVAQRYFRPTDYLSTDMHQVLMEPGKAIPINIEVMDPGRDAMSFELDFL